MSRSKTFSDDRLNVPEIQIAGIVIKPFSKRQSLDSSKLTEFADGNFKSDENGRKFSRLVENTVGKGEIALHDNFKSDENGTKFSRLVQNTVGKGEIARYEQFLHFPQCFLKTCTSDT